ncbi:MAG: aldose epimerase family protein [Opitutaceae bacterium]|jgi:aldose 1-epimerase
MSRIRTQLAAFVLAALTPIIGARAFAADNDSPMKPTRIEKLPFGSVDGKAVDQYILRNANGVTVKIMTRGATVTSIEVPDRQGKLDDVVLGFDNLKGYQDTVPYFGAIVGRVGNRIAKGRFTLDGKTYQLAVNNGPNHLHGGIKGFDKVVWDAEEVPAKNGSAVKFSYLSKDGEEGYPGNCRVEVTYTLGDDNSLKLDYFVTTDADTPVNVTNHSYFNLDGPENGSILDELLTINADRYTPVDSTLIPTGELAPVAGTPMDFRKPTPIGARLQQVGGNPTGYDHNFVVNGGGGKLTFVARVSGPKSGRIMEVYSTEPGVQFYSGNFLDGTFVGKKGVAYKQYCAFCLETQHFPDSVNQPNFPSYVLKAGGTYKSTTVFKFSAK